MKLLISITFGLLSISSLSAQISYSISPLLNTKFQFCNFGGDSRLGGYTEYTNIGHQNPYYTFDSKSISARFTINLGFRLRADINKKHTVSLEWSQDEAGTMSKESAFLTSLSAPLLEGQTMSFGHGISYDQTNFSFQRFSLSYGIQVIKNPTFLEFYFMGDLSFLFGREKESNSLSALDPSTEIIYYHNESTFDSKEVRSWYWGGLATSLGLGCKLDFNGNIKSKSVHLFSVEAMYRQGLGNVAYSLHRTTIVESGDKVNFLNELSSRGSGIYFQISRRFSLFGKRASK